MAKFIDSDGNRIELKPETKVLRLNKICIDCCDGYNRRFNAYYFMDEDNDYAWLVCYMTEEKIKKMSLIEQGKEYKVSGYFLSSGEGRWGNIYNANIKEILDAENKSIY